MNKLTIFAIFILFSFSAFANDFTPQKNSRIKKWIENLDDKKDFQLIISEPAVDYRFDIDEYESTEHIVGYIALQKSIKKTDGTFLYVNYIIDTEGCTLISVVSLDESYALSLYQSGQDEISVEKTKDLSSLADTKWKEYVSRTASTLSKYSGEGTRRVLNITGENKVWTEYRYAYGEDAVKRSESLYGGQGAPAMNIKDAEQITLWSYTDEVNEILEKYYTAVNPQEKIYYSNIPTDNFPNALDDAIASKKNVPDVFTLESYFVSKYIDDAENNLLDLSDVYDEIKNNSLVYPAQTGTHNGKVYALSWQAYPGAVFYRRSLAKKYFGTDAPAVIQQKFSDWNKFLESARELKTKSGGKCVVVSSSGDLWLPFKCSKKTPWITDGKLTIDETAEQYMTLAGTLRKEGLGCAQSQWSEEWFAGMKGELKDENGNPLEVFSYFFPSWGLYYVLKMNAEDTAGDWAMIQGPVPFYWGGTWLAAYKNTKHPELAKKLIKYICSDEGFQTLRAKETGDVMTNVNVTDSIKDSFSEPFLAGQNHYAVFADIAKKISCTTMQASDTEIDALFLTALDDYINGRQTKAQAIQDFQDKVKENLNY